MRVDVQTLGTFNRLVHEGAQRAATSLEQLAGVEPTVEATTIDLASRSDVVAEVEGQELVGVTVEFSGDLSGDAVLTFDNEAARTLAGNLPGGDPDSEEAVHGRVAEVGNILVSGFIDGWADHLDTTIDTSPPTVVAGPGDEVIAQVTPDTDAADQVFSFTSRLETTSAAVDASVFLFPEPASVSRIVADRLDEDAAPIPLDRLHVFTRMAGRGAERASENVTTMTGTATTVEVSRLRFLPIEQTVGGLDDETAVGVVSTLDELGGYLLLLFDEASAGAMAEQLGAGPVSGEFGDMHQSAIEEIGNIMISGFIDGWANVLETSITHSPPEFVHDYAPAIMDSIATQLATRQQYAFEFDSLVRTTDGAVSCEIIALPDEDELTRLLSNLELEAGVADDALEAAMQADPDDVF